MIVLVQIDPQRGAGGDGVAVDTAAIVVDEAAAVDILSVIGMAAGRPQRIISMSRASFLWTA